ncbi:hypothetical protein BH20ACT2_BH20ACT2_15140 [soil metagenome]
MLTTPLPTRFPFPRRAAIVLAALISFAAFAAGCGDDDGADDPGDASSGGPAECELLTDDEVDEAIGPHDPGAQDFVFGGCVWVSTAGPDANGFVETVSVAVLSADEKDSITEPGEPVSGPADGATYSDLHGELVFPCGDGFCVVKAGTADGEGREDIALGLAELVLDRA